MNKAAIDTNVLVAIIDARDKWHPKASALLDALDRGHIEIIWLDCVLNETISVLARRTEEQNRSEQISALLDSILQMIPPEKITWVSSEIHNLYENVVDLIRESGGKLNFHDALIALFCRASGIETILTFDRDFDKITWLKRIEKPDDISLYRRNSS